LINGRIKRAPRDHQYWKFNSYAVHFVVDTNDAAKKLQMAVNDHEKLVDKFSPKIKETVKRFTWENAAKQILDLCK
jgi:glycosyltransferase involved in cell wall biosynthesis